LDISAILKTVNKNRWYIWGMWTTFRRLMVEEICWIGKDIGDFVKVDFLDKYRFYRFAPPSWILNFQTLRFLIDTSRTNKTHILLAAKIRFFRFWAPFWILPPSWITAPNFKRLKMFFGSIINFLHPKIVRKFHDRWRFNRFFSKKMYIWRHLDFWLPFWIFLAITDFFIKVWCFFKIKPFEVCKNIVPLIYVYVYVYVYYKKEDVTIVMILLSTSFTKILSFELVFIWF
jgi:hypothetical protein